MGDICIKYKDVFEGINNYSITLVIMEKVQQIITGLNNQLKMYSYLDKYACIPEINLFQMAPQLHPLFIFKLSESSCFVYCIY